MSRTKYSSIECLRCYFHGESLKEKLASDIPIAYRIFTRCILVVSDALQPWIICLKNYWTEEKDPQHDPEVARQVRQKISSHAWPWQICRYHSQFHRKSTSNVTSSCFFFFYFSLSHSTGGHSTRSWNSVFYPSFSWPCLHDDELLCPANTQKLSRSSLAWNTFLVTRGNI